MESNTDLTRKFTVEVKTKVRFEIATNKDKIELKNVESALIEANLDENQNESMQDIEKEKTPAKKAVVWTFLEHKGPIFAPPYQPLPNGVKLIYDGKAIKLSRDAEEVAGFYAKILHRACTLNTVFNANFFSDWRTVMTHSERKLITEFAKCNFSQMQTHFRSLPKQTKEEKKAAEKLVAEHGWYTIDGRREKVNNCKVEMPGLFHARGAHPKTGKLKRRKMPEDVIVNCSRDSVVPVPPPGHAWKEVQHDPTRTWLACWIDNVQDKIKYIEPHCSSKIKTLNDERKYEKARTLGNNIDAMRSEYNQYLDSEEMLIVQRGIALYLIDTLALRMGNKKNKNKADTVGCCSLRVEHIELHEQKDGRDNVVVFNFLGKDSVRYYKEVAVEKIIFEKFQLIIKNKSPSDCVFHLLKPAALNKHLKERMPELTAQIFRIYQASNLLQSRLQQLTNPGDSLAEKEVAWRNANEAVAILCNHKKTTHSQSHAKYAQKIKEKQEIISDAEMLVQDAKRALETPGDAGKAQRLHKKALNVLQKRRDELKKLQQKDANRNETVSPITSKISYIDPRIVVAWCKKYEVPIEKIYSKSLREKFWWALDTSAEFVF